MKILALLQCLYGQSYNTSLHTCNFLTLSLSLQSPSPNYNVTDMKVPIALFSGGHDWLADPIDVAKLLPMLNSTDKLFYHKNIEYYDHLDFLWAIDVATVVYNEIIALAEKMKDSV